MCYFLRHGVLCLVEYTNVVLMLQCFVCLSVTYVLWLNGAKVTIDSI